MNLRAKVAGLPAWVWLGGVAVIGGVWFIRRRQASKAAATDTTGSTGGSADQYTSGYYAGEADASSMYDQLGGMYGGGGGSYGGGGYTGTSGTATPAGTVTSDGSQPPAGSTGNTTTAGGTTGTTSTGTDGGGPAPTPQPASAPVFASNAQGPAAPFNPYPVGTVVAPNGEKIIQAVASPYGWVDVTSLGGLYTSPGSYVTGSAVGAKAMTKAQSPTGQPFQASISGDTIYEQTGTGVKTFQLKH